ncbi:hypothetical protein BDZ89DRAFT_1034006 [Hymenopellis radicata]|nr:hypothetical protein BDZ89DRAFT_1034006 [Hymenopellis radicata]
MSSEFPLPHYSEYIVIQLDPVTSLERLDDPTTTEACRALKPNKYLACVVQVCSIRPLAVRVINFFSLALPGLRCTHPWNREALVSEPPLPWPNCFHMTLASFSALTKYEAPDKRDHGNYCQPEVADLSFSISADKDWKRRLDEGLLDLAFGDPLTHRSPPPAPLSPSDRIRDEEEDGMSDSESHTNSEDDARSGWDTRSDSGSARSMRTASVVEEDFVDPRPKMPFIRCWVDLEDVPMEEIGNPWDFMKELDILKQLEVETELRVQEKIKAVAGMDAELDVLLTRTRSLLSLTKKADSVSEHSAKLPENEEAPRGVRPALHDTDEYAASLPGDHEVKEELKVQSTGEARASELPNPSATKQETRKSQSFARKLVSRLRMTGCKSSGPPLAMHVAPRRHHPANGQLAKLRPVGNALGING